MSTNTYVTGAFKTIKHNQAYLFMQTEYVLEDYAPGLPNDKILNGPAKMRDSFPSLKCTIFGNKGIDCAFPSSQEPGIAYIFSGNMCAKWFYATECPDSPNNKIVDRPKTIAEMFPYFRGSVFENGVDAAFDSTIPSEAYLFKENQYARINYNSQNCGGHLVNVCFISQGWPCLKETIYESGFDAAFASHITNEAYFFKGDSYAWIQYTPGTTDQQKVITSGKIKNYWQGLGSILPRTNANDCQLVTN